MGNLRNTILSMTILMGLSQLAISQASFVSWEGQAFEDDASSAHSIYRMALKSKDYDLAFENWQKAYDMAPAADGKRDYHFIDGVKLYVKKFTDETDAAKKEEYKAEIDKLYNQAIQAYEDGSVVPTKCVGKPECI